MHELSAEETTMPIPEVQLLARQFTSSGNLGKISEALAKAQGEIEGAKKDSANPFFHSRYADLASVWEACRGPLSKHGLAVIQLPGRNGEGLFVDSILSHSSGEWISSRLFINPVKDDPQGIGSAITYARRYGLQALVGIAPEDDDGEAAMGRQQRRENAATSAPKGVVDTRHPKGKKRAPEPPQKAGDDDEIPGTGKGKFSGPNHESLHSQLDFASIGLEDFMSALKYARMIPENAKSFWVMTDETAKKFSDDFEGVETAVKAWRRDQSK